MKYVHDNILIHQHELWNTHDSNNKDLYKNSTHDIKIGNMGDNRPIWRMCVANVGLKTNKTFWNNDVDFGNFRYNPAYFNKYWYLKRK